MMMNAKNAKTEGGTQPPQSPEDSPASPPSSLVPPIPKSPPTPLDLPDEDGLDLPRTA